MPNESIITEIENLLDEIIALGGQNERTAIVPNLTVQDADPIGLTGFVIVSDDRDGDNILAKKVGSVVYSDNDLVNVMFLRGGEAIAFQQGSQSASTGDIWEVVPSTTTDIFYDRGQVGIGTSTPSVDLHVFDSGVTSPSFGADDVLVVERSGDANLHINVGTANTGSIRFTDNVSGVGRLSYNHNLDEMLFFVSALQRMVIQSDGDVGIEVASPSAQLHVDQSSPTGAQPVLTLDQGDISEQCINMRAGGVDQDINLYTVEVTGTPTLLWDESEDAFSWNKGLRVTSGLVGIGATSPGVDLHIIASDTTSPAWVGADLFVAERAGAARVHIHTGTADEGGLWFTDDVRGRGRVDYDHNTDQMDFSTLSLLRMLIDSSGDVVIGTVAASAQLHVDQSSATGAQPVAYFDQADVSEEMFEFNTTIGVGNAIEAVGAKTLTTTHFIKVTLPGALTRYFPVGTIA